jgi:hypothetical protein
MWNRFQTALSICHIFDRSFVVTVMVVINLFTEIFWILEHFKKDPQKIGASE